MKRKTAVLLAVLLAAGLWTFAGAQEKAPRKTKPKVSPTGEIQLDALHLEAHIEKPSVSIVPKRIEPELQEVEFILRNFDRELREVPRNLFSFQDNWGRVEKIRDLNRLLYGSAANPGRKSSPKTK